MSFRFALADHLQLSSTVVKKIRPVQCTTRVDGALWRNRPLPVASAPLQVKSFEVSNEEYTLAMVTDDQEREDVPTTASGGDVSPSLLKVCKKRSKKRATRTEDQEMLDLNAVHNVHEEKITITIG